MTTQNGCFWDPLRSALDALPDAIFLVDPATCRLWDVNLAGCESLGYPREKLLAMTFGQIAPEVAAGALDAELEAAQRDMSVARHVRTVHRHCDGRDLPVEWLLRAIPTPHGCALLVIARPSEGGGLPLTAPRGETLADPLTGLPNRHLFDQRLQESLRKVQRESAYHFAVLFIDLDRFKPINDTFGHTLGDRLLASVAKRLAGCVRPADMVSRRGGDEFTVLVNGLREPRDALGVAERILRQLAMPFDLEGHPVVITASIGIALGSPNYRHPEQVLHDADRAMYAAKAAGRARCIVFDPGTCADFRGS